DDNATADPLVSEVIDILGNDDYLDNLDPNNQGTTTITQTGGTASGTVSFDADTGELTYTPTVGEAGTTVTVIYEVCNDASGSAVCDTAIVTITVNDPGGVDTDGDGNPDGTDPNPTVPTAVDDNATADPLVSEVIDILINDDYLGNSNPNNVGTTEITDLGTGTAAGSITFNNNTGELIYVATVAEAGTTVTVDYQVCNTDPDPDVCATATVTIVVGNPDNDLDGNPDATDPNPNTPTAVDDNATADPLVAETIDILLNDDYLGNSNPNNLGTTEITDLGTGTAGGSITFNNNTGELIYVATVAEAGTTVTVDYQVCNTDPDPDVCATATVTIVVGNPDNDFDGNPDATDPNPNTPTAVDDNATATPLVTEVIDILINDDYLGNSNPNNLGTTEITDLGTGSAAGTIAFNNNTGELLYTPTAGEAGTTVTVDYQVCNTDPDPDVCATATVTIVVSNSDTDQDGNPDVSDPNPATPTAVDDNATADPGVAETIDILGNDDYLDNLDPNNVGTTAITDLGTGTAAGTIVFDNDTGELIYTPTAGEAGTTVTVDYQVCNTDPDPDVCATATVTIVVSDPGAVDTDQDGNPDVSDPNPATPTAVDDNATADPGVAETIDILGNDDYLDNLDPNNVGTTAITDLGTGTAAGTIVFDNDTGE
ncbi:Ig-like domain-containing protein, partial [Gangjinia marincola]|uniref:Ig-like domain-containing protein n=1 Tax=Gangjinia marincola TaxID=578463 RepID=UPI003CD08325